MIFLVSTPIGNLSDITYRAVETLKKVDLILCEDTRTSGVLFKHYDINTPTKSFHKFNEKKFEDFVISELKSGKELALISDAGTPLISDPGSELLKRCAKEGLKITALPGPSAPITALTLSGFSIDRFQFLGFLPKKTAERKEALTEAFYYPGLSLFFESPSRIQKTLAEIDALSPNQNLAICRELTKKYEEVLRGKASELLDNELRGEIVLVIEGFKQTEFKLSMKEHVKKLQESFDLTKQEAMKLVAHFRSISKKDVYSSLIIGD